MNTFFLTVISLIAFAGNSVLCRMALQDSAIDELSFTAIRLLSGALVLAIILKAFRQAKRERLTGSRFSALMLFIYALTFSLAYVSLDTGTGALILFATVQITMVSVSVAKGARLSWPEWLGLVVAFLGFLSLVLPGATSPSLIGFALMSVSGIAWGIYSLRGRLSTMPLADTAGNFIRTLPLVLVLFLLTIWHGKVSSAGVMLAIISGAVTSGLGYAIWYSALAGLSAARAAIVQLLVPVLAALGGVVFSGESLSLRLIISAVLVLGGIAILVVGKSYLVNRRLL